MFLNRNSNEYFLSYLTLCTKNNMFEKYEDYDDLIIVRINE